MEREPDETVRREFQVIHDIGVVYQRWVTSHCVSTPESVAEIRRIMARDPAVQAMVLRTYAKEVDSDLWPHEITHGNYARGTADDIERGTTTLEIPE